MAPTPTLPRGISRLLGRQEPTATVLVHADTGSTSNSGLDGGAIAGIVIGSVVGILLLWWIIRACTQPRGGRAALGPDASRQGWYDDTPRSRSRSASHGRSRHHHHHHHEARRSGSRHHSRRRSSTPRPVVLEEKYVATPRRPSATYVYPPVERTRSRSRSQGRYYVSG
jgi:hypothetical protein